MIVRKFCVEIETENAAFDKQTYKAEVVRILRETASRVSSGALSGRIYDSNGNAVGSFGQVTKSQD